MPGSLAPPPHHLLCLASGAAFEPRPPIVAKTRDEVYPAGSTAVWTQVALREAPVLFHLGSCLWSKWEVHLCVCHRRRGVGRLEGGVQALKAPAWAGGAFFSGAAGVSHLTCRGVRALTNTEASLCDLGRPRNFQVRLTYLHVRCFHSQNITYFLKKNNKSPLPPPCLLSLLVLRQRLPWKDEESENWICCVRERTPGSVCFLQGLCYPCEPQRSHLGENTTQNALSSFSKDKRCAKKVHIKRHQITNQANDLMGKSRNPRSSLCSPPDHLLKSFWPLAIEILLFTRCPQERGICYSTLFKEDPWIASRL